MKCGPVGLKLIEYFEGYRDVAYHNPGDVWTIGYGTTSGAGIDVHEGMTCTQAQAEAWLLDYIDREVVPAIEDAAWGRVGGFNENQVDALCSLGYNLGAGIFDASHTIGYDIRERASDSKIAADFLLYEAGDGSSHLAGLVTRREVERALFQRPIGAPNPGGI